MSVYSGLAPAHISRKPTPRNTISTEGAGFAEAELSTVITKLDEFLSNGSKDSDGNPIIKDKNGTKLADHIDSDDTITLHSLNDKELQIIFSDDAWTADEAANGIRLKFNDDGSLTMDTLKEHRVGDSYIPFRSHSDGRSSIDAVKEDLQNPDKTVRIKDKPAKEGEKNINEESEMLGAVIDLMSKGMKKDEGFSINFMDKAPKAARQKFEDFIKTNMAKLLTKAKNPQTSHSAKDKYLQEHKRIFGILSSKLGYNTASKLAGFKNDENPDENPVQALVEMSRSELDKIKTYEDEKQKLEGLEGIFSPIRSSLNADDNEAFVNNYSQAFKKELEKLGFKKPEEILNLIQERGEITDLSEDKIQQYIDNQEPTPAKDIAIQASTTTAVSESDATAKAEKAKAAEEEEEAIRTLVGATPFKDKKDTDLRSYSRALKLLNDPKYKLDLKQEDISNFMTGMGLKEDNALLSGKKPQEQKDILKRIANSARDTYRANIKQDTNSTNANTDPYEIASRGLISMSALMTNFKDSRTEAGKENLFQDFLRFIRSGEMNSAQKHEFTGSGEDLEMAQSLDYFKKGNGDPNFQEALLRSLWNAQDNGFDISKYFAARKDEKKSVDDIAKHLLTDLQQSSGLAYPEEMFDRSNGTDDKFIMNPAAFAEKKMIHDTEFTVASLYRKLGIEGFFDETNTAERMRIKISKDRKGAFQAAVTNLPSKLKELLELSFPGVDPNEILLHEGITNIPLSEEDMKKSSSDLTKLQPVGMMIDEGMLYNQIINALHKREQEFAALDTQTPQYQEAIAKRDAMVDFLKPYGIYQAHKVYPAYPQEKYKNELVALVQNLELYEKHFNKNINPNYTDETGLANIESNYFSLTDAAKQARRKQ